MREKNYSLDSQSHKIKNLGEMTGSFSHIWQEREKIFGMVNIHLGVKYERGKIIYHKDINMHSPKKMPDNFRISHIG